MKGNIHISILFILLGFFIPGTVSAVGTLTQVSDTISSSAPGTSTSHVVQFTTDAPVPPDGRIVITFEEGEFTIPASLDYTDIDFLVTSTSSDLVQRELDSASSSTTDAVTVTTGTSGNIILDLNTDTGVGAKEQIRVVVGTLAIHQGTGTEEILNPIATTSHRIFITTHGVGGVGNIDAALTFIAIVNQVGVGPADTTETDPPIRTNGAPQGEIPYNTISAEISLNTDEFAICRYSTTSGVDFDDMTNDFPTTGFVTHANFIVSDLTQEVTYTFYIRCEDDEGNKNPDDYIISFFLAEDPGSGGTGGGTGPGSGGGGGGGGGGASGGGSSGGGGAPFPPASASVAFRGISSPQSQVTILQDGTFAQALIVGEDGVFDTTLTNIPYGTYTFGIYATDVDGNQSATYNTTFYVVGGTGNAVSNIYLPPTIVLDTDRVEPGGVVTASGLGIANSTLSLWTHQQKSPIADSEIIKVDSSTDSEGRWSVAINTTGFSRNTYQTRAKTILPNNSESNFSQYVYFGAGVDPNPLTLLSADLNRDGFVNIIDFSILLFHWGTDGGSADPPPDINQDGTVSLTDFSIMLFQWTG